MSQCFRAFGIHLIVKSHRLDFLSTETYKEENKNNQLSYHSNIESVNEYTQG